MSHRALALLRHPLAWAIIGSAIIVLTLAPTFVVPVYGDDFRLSQLMYRSFDGSLATALADSWRTGWQPNRFNPTGRAFALTYHFAAHWAGSATGIDIHWFYRVGALIIVWCSVLAAAFATREAIRYLAPARVMRLWPIFAGLSALLPLLFTLHPWSHDPTITITEIGWVAAALAFVLFGAAFKAVRSGSPGWGLALVILVAVFGVMFYETMVAAIAATAIVYGTHLWKNRGRQDRNRALWLLAGGVALPALIFVAGRWYVGTLDLAEYPGTELALRAEGLRPLWVLTVGMLPGSSWGMAAQYAGAVRITGESLASGFALVLLVTLVAGLVRPGLASMRSLPLTYRSAVVGAVLLSYLGLSLAMHSFTEKYIAEITDVGMVYLSYAAGILTLSTALVLSASSIRPTTRVRLLNGTLPLVAAIILVNQAVNWSVADRAAVDFAVNRSVTWAVVEDLEEDARCEILEQWITAKAWRDYYRTSVVEAVNWSYARDFGEPFCDRPSVLELAGG